jgi:hypothetical protein
MTELLLCKHSAVELDLAFFTAFTGCSCGTVGGGSSPEIAD